MTLSTVIATWFASGLLKPAPGTWGSAAALPFAWAIATFLDPLALIPAAAILFPVGCWAADRYDRDKGSHDASEIVVDEVVGVWLTLSIVPVDWLHYAIGFAAFRLFDIIKPWPIRWVDRRVSGGFGVMLDDVLAAIYAMATVYGIGFVVAGGIL
ncbi:MAG: phosphatidylglycerophosphatase A [Alphaproteobacteria bacterium]